MSKSTIPILAASLLLVGVVLTGCSAQRSGTDVPAGPVAANTRVGTAVGDTAPDFQLSALDGTQLNLADLHGQPAVLIFWTAWCPVCKEEAPHFNQLATTYESQGVRVVGINIQDSVARTEGGVRDFGTKYKVVRDPDASVSRRYRVTGTPTIIFLDRSGVVRYFGNEIPSDYSTRLAAMIEQKS